SDEAEVKTARQLPTASTARDAGSVSFSFSSIRTTNGIFLAVNSLITNSGHAARTHPSHETRSARKHWRALYDLHGPKPRGQHVLHLLPRPDRVSPTPPLPT